jgi:hypothetical protein
MDGNSLGLLDKSKAGPKGKDDFAVAFHTHSLPMYNTVQILIPHTLYSPFLSSSFSLNALKELSKRDGSG